MVEETADEKLVVEINGLETESFPAGTPFYFNSLNRGGLECDPFDDNVATFTPGGAASVLRAVVAFLSSDVITARVVSYKSIVDQKIADGPSHER